MKGGIV